MELRYRGGVRLDSKAPLLDALQQYCGCWMLADVCSDDLFSHHIHPAITNATLMPNSRMRVAVSGR